MAQQETEHLTRMILGGAAFARAVSMVANLGIADHVQPGAPRSAAYLAEATCCHERSLYRVLRFLASHGVFRGMPLFDYIVAHPELGPVFDAGMVCFHGYETVAMLEAYEFRAIQVLADIGGGNGSLIGSVLQRYPEMRGLLFELGHVAA